MKLATFLANQQLRTADFARVFGVKHCVARRWVRGEAIPNKRSMEKIYEWSGGEVEPNDFYNINQENEHD